MRELCIMVVVIAGCGTDEPRAKLPKVTVERPVPAHVAAIGETGHLSLELQRAFDPHGDFEPMGPPQQGDWLAQHRERPQTYADFLDASTNVPAGEHSSVGFDPAVREEALASILRELGIDDEAAWSERRRSGSEKVR